MKVTVVGTGYVGLVAGTCLANFGNDVLCLDINEDVINKLNKGILPIFEPGLGDLVKRNMKEGRLSFSTDKQKAYDHGDIIFVAVGTPSNPDGSVNLSFVETVAKDIAKYSKDYKIIVDKSTVPVGTADKVKRWISDNQAQKFEFDVVSNPEFLREGAAVKDFLNPDRVVIGAESEKAREIMVKLYKPVERVNSPIMCCDVKSAEMIKYASNAMLATRISFMNEISRVCEKVGADVKVVARGMGLDSRIGPRFLQAGIGYGGSCFPKDVIGFIDIGDQAGVDCKLLKAVEKVNKEQKESLLPKIKQLLGDNIKGKRIGLWGLSFKPKTDDMRKAPSIVIIDQLQKEGASVIAFDPEAIETSKAEIKDVEYAEDPYGVAKDIDCLILVTEWDEFRSLDMKKVKSLMKSPNLIDGRNVFDPKDMKKAGFNYLSVGR